MASKNLLVLVGRVGKDAVFRSFNTGGGVLAFSVATTEKWKDKDGKQHERTDWHQCEIFGKLAESIRDYVTKGKLVYVDGVLRYEEWEKDGVKRMSAKLRVATIQLLSGGKDDGTPADRAARRSRQEPPPQEFEVNDDDVPF